MLALAHIIGITVDNHKAEVIFSENSRQWIHNGAIRFSFYFSARLSARDNYRHHLRLS